MATTPITPAILQVIQLNWTVIISVISVSVAVMGTLIRIFGGKFESDKDPAFIRQTDKINQVTRELERNEHGVEENKKKYEVLKEIANFLEVEVKLIKSESDNQKTQMVEMKNETKKIWKRIDELLRQLMEVIND